MCSSYITGAILVRDDALHWGVGIYNTVTKYYTVLAFKKRHDIEQIINECLKKTHSCDEAYFLRGRHLPKSPRKITVAENLETTFVQKSSVTQD